MHYKTLAAEHAGLQHIDDVEPYHAARDQGLFDELREVLAKHDALARFGITLLHKHFAVYQGERMIESCDEAARTLSMRPMCIEVASDQKLIQTNWRFEQTGQAATLLCFAECLTTKGKHTHEVHKKR